LLCDLVDFERLATAEPQHNDKANRRDRFPQLLPPEFATRSVRPTLAQPSRFDNATA